MKIQQVKKELKKRDKELKKLRKDSTCIGTLEKEKIYMVGTKAYGICIPRHRVFRPPITKQDTTGDLLYKVYSKRMVEELIMKSTTLWQLRNK